jgi:hypothetical protein
MLPILLSLARALFSHSLLVGGYFRESGRTLAEPSLRGTTGRTWYTEWFSVIFEPLWFDSIIQYGRRWRFDSVEKLCWFPGTASGTASYYGRRPLKRKSYSLLRVENDVPGTVQLLYPVPGVAGESGPSMFQTQTTLRSIFCCRIIR